MELMRYLFKVPGVKSFLSQRMCQDPLERLLDANIREEMVMITKNLFKTLKL